MSRGHKTCPACGAELGPRTKKCTCGHEFVFKTMLIKEAVASRRLDGDTLETLPPPVDHPVNSVDTELPVSSVGYELDSANKPPQARVTDLNSQGRGTPLATVWAGIDEVKTFAQVLATGKSAFLQCCTSDKEAIILEIRPVSTKKLHHA